jgi:hypothetical protein
MTSSSVGTYHINPDRQFSIWINDVAIGEHLGTLVGCRRAAV